MSFSYLSSALIGLIPGVITFSILYFLDKIFNYRAKVINIIGSVRIYKIILITSIVLLFLLTDYRISTSPVESSIFFAYLFLVQVPKDLH